MNIKYGVVPTGPFKKFNPEEWCENCNGLGLVHCLVIDDPENMCDYVCGVCKGSGRKQNIDKEVK